MTLSRDIAQAYDRSRDFSGKSVRAACYAPYVSVYFNQLGDAIACCKNVTYVLGNVTRATIDEIWRGSRIKALRRALKDYNFAAGCQHCQWQIESGNYGAAYTRNFDGEPVESELPEWPSMMEFSISNACNYECVMCSGEFSTAIRKFREGLPPLPKPYTRRFFDQLRAYLPHLKRAKFFGGEPFIGLENQLIWDAMIDLGLKIPCHVTTNGSVWDARVERVLENLPISISVSIDGATADTFEAIRLRGKFAQVMANARRFREYSIRKGTTFTVVFCLMQQNWQEFPQMVRMAQDFGVDLWVNTVTDPPACSLYRLPSEQMVHIADELERLGQGLRGMPQNLMTVYQTEINNLRAGARERQHQLLEEAKAREIRTRSLESEAWDLVNAGKLDEAWRLTEQVPDTHHRYWHVRVLRCHIQRRKGDAAGAERELESVLAAAPRLPEAYLERGYLFEEQQRFDRALADANKVLELAQTADQNVYGLSLKGLVLVRLASFDEARGVYDRLLALRPRDPIVRVHRGWGFVAAGMPRDAIAEAEAALALDAGHTGAQHLLASARESLARSLCDAGRFGDAWAIAEALPVSGDRAFHVRVLRGYIQRRLGDLAAADRELAQAEGLRPERNEFFVERGWLRGEQGRHQEALADAVRARELATSSHEHVAALILRGRVLVELKQWDAAWACYDQLFQLRPKDPMVHVQRGWALLSAGRPSESLAEAEAALGLSPQHAEAVQVRAQSLRQLQRAGS